MPILLILLVIFAVGAMVAFAHKCAAWGWVDIKWVRIGDIVALLLTIWWLLKITGVWAYLLNLRL